MEFIEKKKQYLEGLRQDSKEIGEYWSFPALVRELGGVEWQENIDAAGKHASKCILMRGKWIRWNKMEERWEFFRVKSQYVETFTKAWNCRIRSLRLKIMITVSDILRGI